MKIQLNSSSSLLSETTMSGPYLIGTLLLWFNKLRTALPSLIDQTDYSRKNPQYNTVNSCYDLSPLLLMAQSSMPFTVKRPSHLSRVYV